LHRPYGTVGRVGHARDRNGFPFTLLIGLGTYDPDLEAFRLVRELLNIERHQLGAAQGAGEPD
jgi:hypothetical protein